MECELARGLLEAYLDGELGRAEARELEAHVDGCAECRAVLDRLDALRRALREPALRAHAPEQLRARIRDAASAAPRARRRPGALLRHAAALLLAFGAGGGAMYWWNAPHGQTGVTRDLFASHWRALAATSPVDVLSSDRHTVKPWFAGKLAQAPLVQDFAEQGFALVGGRIDYVGAERVPVLVYRHGQHLADVFVLGPDSAPPGPALQRGYALQPVTLGGQRAAIVSDMDAQELARLGTLLSGAR